MATYQELIAQKAALEKQVAELEAKIGAARLAEHGAVLAQIKSLMKQHGVSLAELGAPKKGRAGRPAKASSTARKVAAKYRNAATGDTWSGRGLRPNWLKAALTAGRKIEEFAV